MAADVRLIQVARILGLRPLGLTHDAARDAIAMRAPEMALAFFRDLIAPAAAEVIRTAFREKLRSWG